MTDSPMTLARLREMRPGWDFDARGDGLRCVHEVHGFFLAADPDDAAQEITRRAGPPAEPAEQ